MQFNSKAVKAIHLAVALSMVGSLSSCTDEEFAAGMGAIAIGAGIIAIGAAAGDHHDRGRVVCEGGYRTICHDYRDHWGRWRNECRSEWDSCQNRRRIHSMELHTANVEAAPALNDVNWATTFAISFDSSSRIIAALESAKSGNLQALLDLGLSREDVREMANLKMPSAAGTETMARNLDQSAEAVRAMIERLISIAKAEKEARDNHGFPVSAG